MEDGDEVIGICIVSACLFNLMLFFFFKQKTAYEMRISDWSSDVCSSDLPRNAMASLRVAAGPCDAGAMPLHRPVRRLPALLATTLLLAACTAQIGRASCRERVCQYV